MGESFDGIVDEYKGLDEYVQQLDYLKGDVLSGQNPEPSQTTGNPEPPSPGVDSWDDEDFDDEGWEDGWNPEENNWQNDWSVERWWDKAPTLTAELLKDTDTEKHLLNILSKRPFSTKSQYILNLWDTPEKRLNTIFQKVHTTVNSYLRRQFDILESSPEHDFIDKTVSPAIEWFLLETLRQGGNKGNNQALNWVLDVYNDMNTLKKPGDWKDLLSKITGITKQVNGIYGRVKRIQKVLDCFALHKKWIEKENRDQYKELSNPYEFYMYLEKGDLWDQFNDTDLKDVKITQLQLTTKEGTESQNLSDEQKEQLKK